MLPDPALVVLVGASGSGKSVWAAEHYRPDEVVSSDRLRALVGSGTLDVLSGGRAFCGIGAGWWAREHAGFGLPFPPARARLDELELAIETLRALWQPGRGRTAAAAFAQRHHAGTADEHIGRYRLLADRGVKTVFVSLPHLTDPGDILRLAPLAAVFA